MKIYENKMEFGWDGDNGLGDELIQQIIDGRKTATCSFKVLYTNEELQQVFQEKDSIVTVIDKYGKPKCNIRITDVFETTFGSPDLRLVIGEGDGEDIQKFQHDHKIAWENTVENIPLTNESILIAQTFKVVEVANNK